MKCHIPQKCDWRNAHASVRDLPLAANVHQGTTRYSKVHQGTSPHIIVHHRTSPYIIAHHRTSRHITIQHVKSRYGKGATMRTYITIHAATSDRPCPVTSMYSCSVAVASSPEWNTLVWSTSRVALALVCTSVSVCSWHVGCSGVLVVCTCVWNAQWLDLKSD